MTFVKHNAPVVIISEVCHNEVGAQLLCRFVSDCAVHGNEGS